jgi:hypothetical protein
MTTKHRVTVEIVSRDPNVWLASCGRHAKWTGPTYEAVEDDWRRHVHAETGTAPKPLGAKDNRWMP